MQNDDTSWLPMRTWTAPPAAAACFFRWKSQSTHDFSSSPRSMMSPAIQHTACLIDQYGQIN